MTIPLHRLQTLLLTVGLACAAPSAFCQSFDAVRLNQAAPGQEGGRVGAVAIATYAYQGSDKQRLLLLPSLDYQWANGWFAGFTNGLGYNFSNAPQWQYGLRLTVDRGRKESRSSALHGMGNIDPAAEGGAFFNYSPMRGLILTSSLRLGAGAKSQDAGWGLIVDLGAGYTTVLDPKWRLGASSAITLANTHYMQSYFGVSQAQSGPSGYAVYAANAGARDARAGVSLTYAFDARTALTTVLSVSHLLGDAQNSPLTRKPTSGSGVLTLSYAFR